MDHDPDEDPAPRSLRRRRRPTSSPAPGPMHDPVRRGATAAIPPVDGCRIALAAAAPTAVAIAGVAWLAAAKRTGHRPAPACPTRAHRGTRPRSEPSPADRSVAVYYVGRTAAGPRLFPRGARRRGRARDRPRWPSIQALRSGAAAGPRLPRHVVTAGRRSPRRRRPRRASSRSTSPTPVRRPAGMDEQEAEPGVAVRLSAPRRRTAHRRNPSRSRSPGSRPTRCSGVDATGRLASGPRPTSLAHRVACRAPTEGATVPAVHGHAARRPPSRPTSSGSSSRATRSCATGSPPREECCTLSPYSFDVTAAARRLHPRRPRHRRVRRRGHRRSARTPRTSPSSRRLQVSRAAGEPVRSSADATTAR